MTVEQWIAEKRRDASFMSSVDHWHTLPARPARTSPYPQTLDARIPVSLTARGIGAPYTHQRAAWDALERGEHIVVVTPTASGKTMCYNVPVLDAALKRPESRALYLFPTKALGSDQVASLYELIQALGADIKTYTYDGDTPASARRAIREAGHIVVTNPDMLHANILPSHTKWMKLFENLRYIVIDELHTYRGVFGSNMANVIRRLKRLCAFYGSKPQFVCCSATIANPLELARTLIEENITIINDNGAPQGVRHVVFYNPPIINRQLGIRKGAVNESKRIAADLLHANVSTIVFARSRLHVEVITHALKRLVADPLGGSGKVRGYRSGYLPSERRAIEQGLRAGTVKTVVSTNALELGMDIGSLEACVLCGYPGTIASLWQQAGRAGRRVGASLTVLVASSSPLDQYIVSHPEYFFGQSPEQALVQPDNFHVLVNHFKCAAYELPFYQGERYGDLDSTDELLGHLTDNHFLRAVNGRWHWMSEEFPSAEVHLRSAGDENFLIVDVTKPERHRVIGEMDRFTVPMLLHEHAIYMHEAQQYQVEKLDFPNKKAFVRAVDADYYTDADVSTSLRVLDVFETSPLRVASLLWEGDCDPPPNLPLEIGTKERGTAGAGRVASLLWEGDCDPPPNLPLEIGTKERGTADAERVASLLWEGDCDPPPNLPLEIGSKERGTAGADVPERALGEALVTSMVTVFKKMKLDTHENLGFGYIDLPETQMQTTACWITLPQSRAERFERDDLQNGMNGLAHILRNISPLYLMCARQDIAVHYHVRDPFTQKPTIFLYDTIPGGVGLSDRIYTLLDTLFDHARDAIISCGCDRGCPSCVGPAAGMERSPIPFGAAGHSPAKVQGGDMKRRTLDVLAAWRGSESGTGQSAAQFGAAGNGSTLL
ncbi:MAG: DEAD/DEAH box helicase [Oscillospiraceae bacterium]|nr:DEAD/DEAH box helicase [Oscillospiraceae bacterium]